MSSTRKLSRRSLIDLGGKAAATAGLASLFGPASFASGSGDRACVCLYLLGGNDSNNMIVPLDPTAHSFYARGRGELALPANSLLAVNAPATSARYGFHPSLPGLRDLYDQGVLAVVANVGRAERPMSKAQLQTNPALLPNDLFLHNGATQLRYLAHGYLAIPWAPVSSAPAAAQAKLPVRFPATPTGKQLENVAKSMSKAGVSQHTYFCPVSGFDTHRNQLAAQASLFGELNDALVAFYEALRALGLANRVTLYTHTEFNRTLAPNSRGGSDHGWGGHNLVLGGSVHGGDVCGRLPSMQIGGPDDLGAKGVWIPEFSDQQYAATIAAWFGIGGVLDSPHFSGLRNFPQFDLGFLAS